MIPAVADAERNPGSLARTDPPTLSHCCTAATTLIIKVATPKLAQTVWQCQGCDRIYVHRTA